VSVLVVTGTGTGIGKTVVTAALAALALAEGRRVAVLKPVQTGVAPGQPGDLDDVRRLVGRMAGERLTTLELARYPDPLAPATAAARAGREPVTPADASAAAHRLSGEHDLVLVEGAGGLLVRFTTCGTLADIAGELAAPVLVVTSAALGTLNHTELTTSALAARGLRCAGLAIGSWPAHPDLAAECNLVDLPAVTGVPLLGRLPAGAGVLEPEQFLAEARRGFGAALPPEPGVADLT
jgi:dethiobiotin synthetase